MEASTRVWLQEDSRFPSSSKPSLGQQLITFQQHLSKDLQPAAVTGLDSRREHKNNSVWEVCTRGNGLDTVQEKRLWVDIKERAVRSRRRGIKSSRECWTEGWTESWEKCTGHRRMEDYG
ncbi:hypothetical protein VIGAN_03027100 [Vigna angularis var. angularis]|uniref:Uncharacterized protein n=1 Tax=Vigna angularis var. angularis TaxID=157739 RepID=A0A0S3RJK8_PHAAN|nr:hypothetical protein VIGAN_03027100 [Vigna angularis var. angularis]